MGLFDKKVKLSVDQMLMAMLIHCIGSIEKVKGFNDVDDSTSITVSIGYYYGMLRSQLNVMTDVKTSEYIVEKSIENLGEALKGNILSLKIGNNVKEIYNNCYANIINGANSSNIAKYLANSYLEDLYHENDFKSTQLLLAETNLFFLYSDISNHLSKIKIVK